MAYQRLTTSNVVMDVDDAYKELAAAIVRQAMEDYYVALQENDEKEISAVQRFVESEWFLMLTSLDGKAMLHEMERRVAAA